MIADSPLRKRTPGTRLTVLLILMTSAFAAGPFLGLILLMIYQLALYRRASYPAIHLWRRLKPLWPLILLMGIFQTLFVIPEDSSNIWWQFGILEFSRQDITLMGRFILRFLSIITLFHLFTEILSTNELSHGVEELLRPLEKRGISVHTLGLALTLTFRFIPLMRQELERLDLAQRARGARFDGKRQGLIKKVSSRLPLFIPLFISALERSELLVEAMEARGYQTDGKRSRYLLYTKNRRDLFWILEVLVLLSFIFVIKFIRLDEITGAYIYEIFQR